MQGKFNHSLYLRILLVWVVIFIASILNTDNGCDLCIFPGIIGIPLFISGSIAGWSFAKIAFHFSRQMRARQFVGVLIGVIGAISIAGISIFGGLALLFLRGLT